MENTTNEIMEVVEAEVMEGEVVDSGNDIGTGVAVILGAVGAAVVYGAVKLGRKMIDKIKAKKAAEDEAELVEVSDDDIEEQAINKQTK